MMHAIQLAVLCREGRLVITRESVSLFRRHSLRRRPKWTVARADVPGACVMRRPSTVYLTISAIGCQPRFLRPLHPVDALRVVELLGYAAGASPALYVNPAVAEFVALPCAGGRALFTGERLTFSPRLPWRRARTWTLSFAEVSGAGSSTRPGTRMLHDLIIHTTDGRIFTLNRLRPEHALALLRLFGNQYAALPTEPTSRREALEHHTLAKPRPLSAPEQVAIASPQPQAKPREIQRELDDLWSRQRGLDGHYYHPLPGM